MRTNGRCGWWAVPALVIGGASVRAPAAEPGGIEFFEQKIRPVLVKHCYSCHSVEAKKAKGGLRVDTRQGLLKGGASGPSVVPGKVTDSRLLAALRHDGVAMPPDQKLPDPIVADFTKWVRMGAPDPRDGKPPVERPTTIDIAAGRKFWSFQPPQRRAVPKVADAAWPRTDVDRFLLAALEAKGVKPVADAEPAALLRRMTVALTGLPPTPEEVDAFVNQWAAAPQAAVEKTVDRLLASQHFGERWGRHWLDVARYADSNGKDENLTFHESFRYRDYVIDSFNRDKPFDRFIVEQIAGDLMPAADAARSDEQLTATGFLVIGPKVLAERDKVKLRWDVVDEQIDTVGRTFMGLTLGCARCHDHKFDPVPTADYYGLAGIFGSTHTVDGKKLGNAAVSGWMLRTLGGGDGDKLAGRQAEHQKKLDAVAAEIKKVQAELKGSEDKATMRQPTGLAGVVVDDKEAKLTGAWKASQFTRPYVGSGYVHDDKAGKGAKSAVFTPALPGAGEYEVQVSYTTGGTRATNVPVIIRHADGETTVRVDQSQTPKIDKLFSSVGKFRFAAGTAGSVTISTKGTEGFVIVDAVRFVPTGIPVREPATALGVPMEVKDRIAELTKKLKELEAQDKALRAAAPPPPRTVLAVRDEAKIENVRIHVRGVYSTPGPEAPRGFLSVALTGERPTLPADRSGRLELAKWIADPGHPLTARVMVNRVWMHLFGEGLVRTVDNFGMQGERPSHPELLDELALRFAADGWSVKRLIKSLMLSRAYGLASAHDAAAFKADPENRLLWRAHRRRAEAEVIRDSILTVSGKLDRTMGGSAVATLAERAIDNNSKGGLNTEDNNRRSVYLPIIRNDVPQVLEVFDFADPDVAVGRRDATTVATQALYLMNSHFANVQARETAKRLVGLTGDDAGRLTDLYRRAVARAPTSAEAKTVLQFLADQRAGAKVPNAELDAWTSVCLAMFGSTEFRFIE